MSRHDTTGEQLHLCGSRQWQGDSGPGTTVRVQHGDYRSQIAGQWKRRSWHVDLPSSDGHI